MAQCQGARARGPLQDPRRVLAVLKVRSDADGRVTDALIAPAPEIRDMTSDRSAGIVIKALKTADHRALVRVDMATFTVEIEESRANARQLSDAIKRAGYSPVAA